MLFSKQDPMEDLLSLLRAKNPAVTQPVAAFTVTSVAVATGLRNTSVTLRADIEYGVKGTFNVALDRTDLSELYNKFPTGTKRPLFRHHAVAGSTVTMSAIIDQINQMLGTSFTMSGALQDLTDAQFVMPTKDSSIMVSIKANAKSVRLVPNTTLEIEIYSSGAVLSNALVNRSLNPIVSGSGLISYGGVSVNPASPKKHPGMALKFMDFSATMVGRTNWGNAIHDTLNSAVQGRDIWINGDLYNNINNKLIAAGLPALTSTALYQTRSGWSSTMGVSEWYWTTYMFKRTADFKTNPLVNSDDFQYFLVLPKNTMRQAETATSYATDYFIHYNL